MYRDQITDALNKFKEGKLTMPEIMMRVDDYTENKNVSGLPVREILSLDQPWPLPDILNKLVEAAEILLDKKSYDGHGYEEINHAVERAKQIAALFTKDGETESKNE